ncbi:hypothetical protein [Nonomuraea sp. NPDC052265]|uniref:hypothetical protein n=1 Tax=Nonomuraea sp. NPDC052265 TaxID=3364374 RepID=UPI0037C6CD14
MQPITRSDDQTSKATERSHLRLGLTAPPRTPTTSWFGQRDVRCSLLRPDPAQCGRLEEIRDNLIARIAEAEREGRLGEVEGLQVSLAGAEEELAQMDRRTPGGTAINLGMPRMTPAQPIREEEGTASLRQSMGDQQ